MKILFLGSVIKTSDCTQFLGPSVAGNKMQIGILKGLNKLNEDITVITEMPIAAFPKEKKLLIKSANVELFEDMKAKKVPFINLFIFKQITMIISAFFMLFKWCFNNRREKMVIITFNSFPYISIPVMLVSKFFSVVKVCIFADPPIEVIKRNLFGRIAKHFEDMSTQKNVRKYDGLIVLNKKTVEKYAPNAEYLLVDGGFDTVDIPNNQPGSRWIEYKENDLIDIVFSGGLYEYNGVINLIKAFVAVKNDRLRLMIYGEGPLRDYVIDATKKDCRIKYKGNVHNDIMLKIQQNSSILINPRPVNEPISLYTFPSKMIEYMLSGTPVITTKLNGLTSDYLKNVFVLEDNSVAEIARCIEYVTELKKEHLVNKAYEARKFIINNKNWDIQTRKIYHFIKGI